MNDINVKSYKNHIMGYQNNFQNMVFGLGDWLRSLLIETPKEITIKSDGTIVTNYDFLISEKIKHLASLFFSDVTVVSEEDTVLSPNFPSSNTILIDPLDGTENFASGIPIWGIGVAMFVEGDLLFTCVLFPEIRMGQPSNGIFLPEDFREFRQDAIDRNLSLFPANLDVKDILSLSSNSKPRITGCSLLNIALINNSSPIFMASGEGIRCWDFIPAILPKLQNGFEVYVNNMKYRGHYLSPLEKYNVRITKGTKE